MTNFMVHALAVTSLLSFWVLATGCDPSSERAGGDGEDTDSKGDVHPEDAGDGGTDANGETPSSRADVIDVTVSGEPNAYVFSVTVSSTDIDCTQYADFWEVLSEAGALIYRRILRHSHTAENRTGNPFTRESEDPVSVAADQVVIVRAHMNNGGYGGQAMKGSPSTGFVAAPAIGPEFAADVEDDEPQPDTCAF